MLNRLTGLPRLALASSALVALSLAGCSDGAEDFDISKQIGPNPELPEPAPALLPSLKVAEVVGWKDGRMPTVPEGMTIAPYATDLANPRTVHTLPNGDVLVVQSQEPEGKPVSRPKDVIRGWIMSIAHGPSGPKGETNRISLLRDGNRDGKVDEKHELLTRLHSPFGVAWIDDTLYVAAADAVLAYPYRLGENTISAAPRVLTPLPGGPLNHHWTKDLALGPDGRFLYASVGSNSNVLEHGLEAEKGRAAIWEIDRQTGAARVYASGLRNPNGLAFNPDTRALWTVVNERDELGPNLVPDYMTSVKDGGFYGWPWSYYGNHVDARVHPPRPDMVEKAIAPDYALSSHVAALGLTFSKGSALPAPFANGAFVGEHGSWNRSAFNGYKVVYVPFENGKPVGKAQDVVTGFIDGDQAQGRPVGVGIDGTGALLVADDSGNTVWRVSAADGAVSPQPVGTDVIGPVAAAAASSGGSPQPEPGGPAAPPATESPSEAGAAPPAGTGAPPAASDGPPPSPSPTDIAPAAPPLDPPPPPAQ